MMAVEVLAQHIPVSRTCEVLNSACCKLYRNQQPKALISDGSLALSNEEFTLLREAAEV